MLAKYMPSDIYSDGRIQITICGETIILRLRVAIEFSEALSAELAKAKAREPRFFAHLEKASTK